MHAATAPAAVANKEMRVSPLYYDRGQQVAPVMGCGTRSPLSTL